MGKPTPGRLPARPRAGRQYKPTLPSAHKEGAQARLPALSFTSSLSPAARSSFHKRGPAAAYTTCATAPRAPRHPTLPPALTHGSRVQEPTRSALATATKSHLVLHQILPALDLCQLLAAPEAALNPQLHRSRVGKEDWDEKPGVHLKPVAAPRMLTAPELLIIAQETPARFRADFSLWLGLLPAAPAERQVGAPQHLLSGEAGAPQNQAACLQRPASTLPGAMWGKG